MIYVSTSYLQAFLLSFACVFYVVAFVWTEIRRRKMQTIDGLKDLRTSFSDIRKMDNSYKMISVFFMAMIVCYVTLPSIYRLLIPIKEMDNPLIDDIGLLILNVSLVLIVVAQMDIDKEIFRLLVNNDNDETRQLLLYSKRKYIVGILTMFVGVVLTISTIIGSVVMVLAFLMYRKDFRLQPAKR